MYTGFCHICRIDEESKGLRLTFEEAPAGLLRNDHAEFQLLRDYLLHLLHETQTRETPRPTWVALDEDRIITEVRMVLKGIPMSARRDSSGAYLIVFPFTNMSTKLSPDHPRFQEFERYLLQALKHETPLTYVVAAEDFYTIDDMIPPPPSCRPLQDGVVEEVAGGRVVTNVANDVPT
jgi:hypothetical protein